MEQQTMFNEIIKALKAHGEQLSAEMKEGFKRIDERFEQVDKRFEQVDKRFEQVEQRLDRLEKKFDGLRAEVHDTKEDVNYLLGKNARHEEKLHQLTKQQ